MPKVEIRNEENIVLARHEIRNLADELGFSIINKTRLATAVSELSRNTLVHGQGGQMVFQALREEDRVGIQCTFSDEGPGIENVDEAMQEGFSTARSLGQGLPGTRRLVDDFAITSEPGKGTTVEITKWQ
ncbi:MAG: anti-sigma regulatory factor [Proteobacteria bacterium]|nr:anti-sigma regulatory factor [Pseudomonadota bacterium]